MSVFRRIGTFLGLASAILALNGCISRNEQGEPEGLTGTFLSVERWRAGLERKTIEVNGEKIVYLDGGQGDPLILVHGFGGSKDNYNRVSKFLTPYMRVIALDLPGFGASSKDMDGDYSIKTQAKRVHDFAQALGLKHFHIGGNSMGGWISGVYAATYPKDVGSVWFLAPAGLEASLKSEVIQAYAKDGKILLTAANADDYERIIDLVFYKRPALMPRFALEAMGKLGAENQPLHNKIYKGFRQNPTDMDQQIAQSGYDKPALIVWGENDRVLHVDGAAQLAKALPQAKLIVMKETGHSPMFERPEESAKDYLAFRGLK